MLTLQSFRLNHYAGCSRSPGQMTPSGVVPVYLYLGPAGNLQICKGDLGSEPQFLQFPNTDDALYQTGVKPEIWPLSRNRGNLFTYGCQSSVRGHRRFVMSSAHNSTQTFFGQDLYALEHALACTTQLLAKIIFTCKIWYCHRYTHRLVTQKTGPPNEMITVYKCGKLSSKCE